MILFIDTSSFHELHFALIPERSEKTKTKEKIYKFDHSQTSKTLAHFKKFFGKTKWSVVEKIIVVSGPGSFSGIRVGISMALAFSIAHDLPAFAIAKNKISKDISELSSTKTGLKKIGKDFEPEYGAEPNITLPNAAKFAQK